MTEVTGTNWKKLLAETPVESKRAIFILRSYVKSREGKRTDATSYNLRDHVIRDTSIPTIEKWLASAYNRKLVFHTGWYLNSMTYQLTVDGEFLADLLEQQGFRA